MLSAVLYPTNHYLPSDHQADLISDISEEKIMPHTSLESPVKDDKKPRKTSKASTPTTAKPRRQKTRASTTEIAIQGNGIERDEMIAVAAYYRAERRGFNGGDTLADWLEAEAEVDALLQPH